MTETVKNISDILIEFEAQLRGDVRTKDMIVSRMGHVNLDASRAVKGWVGIYADGVRYEPRTLGMGFQNWNFVLDVKLVVQASHANDSGEAHKRLERFIKDVLDVLFEDVTVGSLVEKLDELQIEYATDENDSASLHFEGALISLQFSGRTN